MDGPVTRYTTNIEKDAALMAYAFLTGTRAGFAAITEDYARRVMARTREILDELKAASDIQETADG